MKSTSHGDRYYGAIRWSMVLMLPLVVSVAIWQARSHEARADVRRADRRPQFKSGGQLSARTLTAIANTLERIDRRLARIEQLAASRATPQTPASALGATVSRPTTGVETLPIRRGRAEVTDNDSIIRNPAYKRP